jgi:hypothetical protein
VYLINRLQPASINKYFEPTADLTIDESNIILRSMGRQTTSIEDVWTQITGKVKLSYVPEKRFEKTMVYSKNVDQYGLRKREIDFFIYNIESLAKKSLNFWGARFSNVWRKATFTLGLEAMQLQLFDTLNVNMSDTTYLENTKAVVDKVDYNLRDSVKVDLWLPMTAGTVIKSGDAWQDDSGDTAPTDPTLKVDVDPFDWQHPNGESRRRTSTKQDGGGVPAIVVEVLARDNPFYIDGTPLIKVDLYTNGYSNPATKVGVLATPIDPSASTDVGQHLLCIYRGGKIYYETGAASSLEVPAIIRETIVSEDDGSHSWKADIYGSGYDKPATKTSMPVTTDDPNIRLYVGQLVTLLSSSDKSAYKTLSGQSGATYPAKITEQVSSTTWYADIYEDGWVASPTTTNVLVNIVDDDSFGYVIDDKVSIYRAGETWFVATEKQFDPTTIPPIQLARITANNGGGAYSAEPVESPGGAAISAPVACVEMMSSDTVATGTVIELFYWESAYYFRDVDGDC